MRRRNFLKGLTAIASSTALSAHGQETGSQTEAAASQPTARRPNILYIHTHDTGRHIQPYGHPVSTPHLQRLAEEGVLFRQAFCASPSCSPARAALLTGQYPHSNGMYGLSQKGKEHYGGFQLHDMSHHLQHTLKQAGYHTALAGVEHIVEFKPRQLERTIGHDEIVCFKGDPRMETKVDAFLARPRKKPFFLTVGYGLTHRYFAKLGPDDQPDYCMPPKPLPDHPITRRDYARFKKSAEIVDQRMGKIFAALERPGLTENTLIIATTDHGIPFPRMKGTLRDGGTEVFLIMKGPAPFRGSRILDGMVNQIDLFPTLCEYLAIDAPRWLQGKSFMPLVRNEVTEIHDALFTELTYHRAYEPMRCIRTKRFKYIRRFDMTALPYENADPNGYSGHYWLDHGWNDEDMHEEMLFDLMFDPNEMNNLIGKPRYQKTHAELRERLSAWMKATDDPLLRGPIPWPAPPEGDQRPNFRLIET